MWLEQEERRGGYCHRLNKKRRVKGMIKMLRELGSIGRKLNLSFLTFVVILWLLSMSISFLRPPLANPLSFIIKCKVLFVGFMMITEVGGWMKSILCFYEFQLFLFVAGKGIIIGILPSLSPVMSGKRLLISPWKLMRWNSIIVGSILLCCCSYVSCKRVNAVQLRIKCTEDMCVEFCFKFDSLAPGESCEGYSVGLDLLNGWFMLTASVFNPQGYLMTNPKELTTSFGIGFFYFSMLFFLTWAYVGSRHYT